VYVWFTVIIVGYQALELAKSRVESNLETIYSKASLCRTSRDWH